MIRQTLQIAFVALATAGCANPFALREGEPPEELPDWWLSPITPQTTLLDLVQIYQNQEPSLITMLLADDYLFFPDPADALGIPDGGVLDAEEEARFTRNLLDATPAAPLLVLTETDEHPDPEQYEDSIELYRDYVLTVDDPFGSQPPIQIVALGEALFLLQRVPSGSEWEILDWKDQRGATDWSWGELKLELVGGS